MPREAWTREEQLLAFNLYCKLPFGQYHRRNPQVIELAHLIKRTPSAVAMKLSNFASFDPYHQKRGVKGLSNASRADKAIWEEFYSDWNKAAIESEVILAHLTQSESPPTLPQEISDTLSLNETERTVKVRLGQAFFRAAVLSNYREICCICAMPIKELLIASHIIPWKDRDDLRLNPHNGLCLCALHDKAFDQGFITVTVDYEIKLSSRIKHYLPNKALAHGFEIYEGQSISQPDKFLPRQEFLQYHNEHYFLQD